MAKKTTTSFVPRASKGTPSTARYLEVAEFHNDTVIMRDGTLRAVLLVSSINFFLKSEDEQNGIVQGYMQLLNSFDFPIQIVVQSRKFDISKYIAKLEKIEKDQQNDLLRLQIADYRQFVSELVTMGQIMDKKFFAIVPYDPSADSRQGFFKQVSAVFSAGGEIKLKREQFEERKHFLDLRVDAVAGGMNGMGVNAVRLDTQSLVELFYSLYNPDVGPQEKMAKAEQLLLET